MQRAVSALPELARYSGIDVVARTGSTNADLVARAGEPDIRWRVLVAEAQDAGRGRHERHWVSPPRAAIALSVLVPTAGIDPQLLGWLPLLTGIAVVDAVRAVTGLDARLKWPNDVLIAGRKLAGILVEVVPGGFNGAAVVGIGCNVSLRESELPVPHATSLAVAGAPGTDRTALVLALLREFASRFSAWQEAGWDRRHLASDYRTRCATLGSEVRAELPGGEVITGVATDIDWCGRLSLDTQTHGTRTVAAGDVTHLRSGTDQQA